MIYIARALQRDLVRWLLWCVRLRWLSFGRGHFGGFAGWASLRTANLQLPYAGKIGGRGEIFRR